MWVRVWLMLSLDIRKFVRGGCFGAIFDNRIFNDDIMYSKKVYEVFYFGALISYGKYLSIREIFWY